MTKTEQAVEMADRFAATWNRGDWMVEHGEWASTEWDEDVCGDSDDYIVEGVIDPDGVSGECNDANRVDSASAQGWDCTEGHHTHLLADGRVAYNWYRSAFGQRHRRDLYVVVGTVEQET